MGCLVTDWLKWLPRSVDDRVVEWKWKARNQNERGIQNKMFQSFLTSDTLFLYLVATNTMIWFFFIHIHHTPIKGLKNGCRCQAFVPAKRISCCLKDERRFMKTEALLHISHVMWVCQPLCCFPIVAQNIPPPFVTYEIQF